MRRDWGKR